MSDEKPNEQFYELLCLVELEILHGKHYTIPFKGGVSKL